MVSRFLPFLLGTFVVSALAQEVPTYPGSSPTAEWRKQAEEKIEQLRKGELVVLVLDAVGAPVKDAAVTIKQQRHAFPFSIVVDPALFGETGDDKNAREYRDHVGALFGMVHPPKEATLEAVEAVRLWATGFGLPWPDPAVELTEVTVSLDPAKLSAPTEVIAGLAPDAKPDPDLRLADYAFPVDPTETSTLELQAYYTRDLFTAAFADPRVAEIQLTHLWAESATDKPGWALYNHDWSPRPVAEMLKQLLRKTWWTEDGGLTTATGEWAGRVFLGEYRISVANGARTKTVSANVLDPHTIVEVNLEPEPAPAPSATPESPPDSAAERDKKPAAE